MTNTDLFEGLSPSALPKDEGAPLGAPRLLRPDRMQREIRYEHIDTLIPPDHRARAFWAMTEGLDLSAFEDKVKSREHGRGRPAIAPQILLCVWLYGLSRNVGSGRQLEELCFNHDAFRWILGGVKVTSRTLNAFRSSHEKELDALFTQLLTALDSAGVIDLETVAQDGMRLRTDTAASSFRREQSLKQRLEAAKQHIQDLKNAHMDGGEMSKRQRAASERAARDMEERTARAIEELPKVRELQANSHKKKSKQREPRTSTSDPQARIMKMADGGFRPAYNLQLATETRSQFVVGISVVNVGSDSNLAQSMVDQISQRLGRLPSRYLVDGGFLTKKTIEDLDKRGTLLYAPIPQSRGKGPVRLRRRANDSRAVMDWRARMESPDGQLLYKLRGEIAENTNAELRAQRGLGRFGVRGLAGATCCALLSGIALNFLRVLALS